MKLNSCGELKLFDIFLKLNDKFRCPSGRFHLLVNEGSSLMKVVVNEGLSLTIVNITASFIKKIIFQNAF